VVSSGSPVDVELLRPYGQEPPPLRPLPEGHEIGELIVRLPGCDAALAFRAPLRELADLHDLLTSLADQAALALARINLMETARIEERERYFRTLVLTSTDVILISRAGRIEYATPSARSMFGRDVEGQDFDGLVQPAADSMHAMPDMRVDEHGHASWPATVPDGIEATVRQPDGGEVTVLVHRRDLTGDATVNGVVTTLRDVTEERALKRDLAYRASHDEMTGLCNSRAWEELVGAEGERRRPPGEGIGVIFIDLDNFKQINDRFGHPVGDKVLAEVGRRIKGAVRGGDVAARVGGDEFAALLRGLSSVEDARRVARRLAETLAAPAAVDSLQVECQASIGLAYTDSREPVPALVKKADTALYAAKEQGKGRWAEYDSRQWRPNRATRNGAAGGASSAGAGGRTIR
jgi:diguanylate cyclase (GGDEF)-like protein/PAS domain S-box-containing protein